MELGFVVRTYDNNRLIFEFLGRFGGLRGAALS